MPVPPLVIDATGISGPDYPTVLAALTSDFQAIYGSDAILTSDSQDGQLLAVFALAIYNTQQQCIATYNAFSPLTAQGVGLSSLVKINGLARLVPTNSQANVTITGTAGTPINNGQIGDNLGLNTVWSLPASVVIPLSGTITETVTCTAPGATAAAPNTLTTILTPTLGWASVTNPSAATSGSPLESDAALRQRQTTSVALPAETNLSSIYASIAALSGVTRLVVLENNTDSTDSRGIPSHSIAAVVAGGDAVSICTAIAGVLSPGTGTFGSISEIIVDSHGIAITINFDALSVVQIDVTVTIKALTNFTTTTETLIQQAVAYWLSNLDIGETSYFLRIVGPANLEGDAATQATGLSQTNLDTIGKTFTVTGITQARHGNAKSAQDLPMAFNEAAACVVANIVVTVT